MAKEKAKKVTKKSAVKTAPKTVAKAKVGKSTGKTAAKAAKKIVSSDKVDFLKAHKDELIKVFAQNEGDTGSPEVQIAVLTQRILLLQQHLLSHKKDNHSRRGLLQMVGKRRRLLEYLKRTDADRAQKMLKAIDLGK